LASVVVVWFLSALVLLASFELWAASVADVEVSLVLWAVSDPVLAVPSGATVPAGQDATFGSHTTGSRCKLSGAARV
jgi:hypothetical protein